MKDKKIIGWKAKNIHGLKLLQKYEGPFVEVYRTYDEYGYHLLASSWIIDSLKAAGIEMRDFCHPVYEELGSEILEADIHELRKYCDHDKAYQKIVVKYKRKNLDDLYVRYSFDIATTKPVNSKTCSKSEEPEAIDS